MVVKLKQGLLLLLASLVSSAVVSGTYIGLAPAQVQIKTGTGSTIPLLADMRLGYALAEHKFELSLMSSIRDDTLNQLITDIPTSASLLYRYTTNPDSEVQIELILGYSQFDIVSSYINVPEFSETYQGVSYGVGFEEALKSIPRLKIKLDYIRLYGGDKLDVNSLSLGIRYEF